MADAGSSSSSLHRPIADRRVRAVTPLSAYVAIVAAAGSAALAESLLTLHRTPRPLECALFAALAILTGSFSTKVVGVPARISVSDTFFLTIALLFGPSAAVITVAADSMISSWRKGDSPLRLAFNTTAPALAMWAGSHAFFVWSRVAPFAQDDSSLISVPAPLFCVTAIYFLINSTLLAGAVALETRQRVWTFWHRHFRWLSVSYMASGSAAFCLVMLVHHLGAAAIAVILPVVAVFHITLRSSFGRLEDARRHLGDMDRLYLSTVETLAMAIDAKDDVTHSHVRRVQTYAVGLANELGVADEPTVKAIQAAALLHDTGKLAIPEHILNKPGKLNDAEFETMKLHVDVGADILSLVDFPYPVVPIVRCHHENWDGGAGAHAREAECARTA
jgi:putative nucleotidyltransferase with HDIG domain